MSNLNKSYVFNEFNLFTKYIQVFSVNDQKLLRSLPFNSKSDICTDLLNRVTVIIKKLYFMLHRVIFYVKGSSDYFDLEYSRIGERCE